jgi:hypothetical protein
MAIIYDWSFAERVQCTQADRTRCLGLVADLVDLAAKARRLGLLSLVDTIEGEQHFLLQKGLQLIVDGVKPEVVRRILENYILSDNCSGRELLTRCLILEGIAGIQNGVNPKNIKEMLLSFFGTAGPAMYAEKFKEDGDENLDDLLNAIDTAAAPQPSASSLSETLHELADQDIQECLKEVSTRDLARAVQGMSGGAQIRIFRNLSRRGASYLQKMLTEMDPVVNTDMLAAQDKILSIISDLKSRGAIHGKHEATEKSRPAPVLRGDPKTPVSVQKG